MLNMLIAADFWNDWVFWVVAGCSVITAAAVIIMIVFAYRASRKPGGKSAQTIKVKDGIRYSTDTLIETGNQINVTHNTGDFMLARGKTYVARQHGKNGDLLPGQYTLLTTSKGEQKFNIRLGGFVREYSHGDAIVIPDGESITCTSHSVVLR